MSAEFWSRAMQLQTVRGGPSQCGSVRVAVVRNPLHDAAGAEFVEGVRVYKEVLDLLQVDSHPKKEAPCFSR
jgi:hypothetical protein